MAKGFYTWAFNEIARYYMRPVFLIYFIYSISIATQLSQVTLSVLQF